MKLDNFSVTNFRSITKAHQINMRDLTILVGKNNEGKSNILSALSMSMDIMKQYPDFKYFRKYNWNRDFPLSQQEQGKQQTSMNLIFDLEDVEVQTLKTKTGIRLNNTLPIRITLNKAGLPTVDIPKKGTTAFGSAENKQTIIEFICEKIDFNYIPAVRTEEEAIEAIDILVGKSLKQLEDNDDYRQAIQAIEKLQQSVLDELSENLKAPLQTFIPSISNIIINIQQERRRLALRRNIDIIINDGAETPIQYKGDGIKSLVALGILNMVKQQDTVSVIAIEEPESHLHPAAARQLYKTITDLAQKYQIILTTHSPLFINRDNLSNNIIVEGGKAVPVKYIKDIRDVLGISVSDNLYNVETILVVEGEDDKKILEKLLPLMSDKIKKVISSGTFIISALNGASNLAYMLSLYRNIQCKYHILLDYDDAGRTSGEKAEKDGLVTQKNVTYTICNGSPDAELEDCLLLRHYEDTIKQKYGVNLSVKEFKNNKKWSDRVKACFQSQGKKWDKTIEMQVKLTVAELTIKDPKATLEPHKSSSIHTLVKSLEDMIDKN